MQLLEHDEMALLLVVHLPIGPGGGMPLELVREDIEALTERNCPPEELVAACRRLQACGVNVRCTPAAATRKQATMHWLPDWRQRGAAAAAWKRWLRGRDLAARCAVRP